MRLSIGKRAGFSLIEVTLALGIAAFSLLAVFGLLTTGTQINHTAVEQTASTDILTAIANDLRATPATITTSPQFGIAIPANPINAPISVTLYFDSTGQSATTLSGSSRYRLVATFLANQGVRSATLVNLKMSWPAAADPTNANTGSADIFLALDRN